MADMRKLLLLRDQRPGHSNQVEGLALALARHMDITLERVDVRPRPWLRSDVRETIARRWIGSPAAFVHLAYGVDLATLTRPDVILASGSKTVHFAVMAARHFGAKVVFSGWVNRRDAADVTLQLVQTPRDGYDPGRAYCLLPSMVDPDRLPPRRDLTTPGALHGARLSLLVGGNSERHIFRQQDWDGLLALIPSVAALFRVRWLVTTSRRTPPAVSTALRKLADKGLIETFIDYAAAGPGSLMQALGGDAVLVTEDSNSMISDGLAARRPVIALKPSKVMERKGNEYIAAIAGSGQAAVLPMWAARGELVEEALREIRVAEEDPRDWIARVVMGRF